MTISEVVKHACTHTQLGRAMRLTHLWPLCAKFCDSLVNVCVYVCVNVRACVCCPPPGAPQAQQWSLQSQFGGAPAAAAAPSPAHNIAALPAVPPLPSRFKEPPGGWAVGAGTGKGWGRQACLDWARRSAVRPSCTGTDPTTHPPPGSSENHVTVHESCTPKATHPQHPLPPITHCQGCLCRLRLVLTCADVC